jgi:hypothetical protein
MKLIIIFLLILFYVAHNNKAYNQITRGAEQDEIYISTDWYIDNSGHIHYAIFHSINNGENIHLKYENIETPPLGEMSVGGILGDATPGALYNFDNNELWVSLNNGENWEFKEIYPDNTKYLSGQVDGTIFKRVGAQLSQSNNYGDSFLLVIDPINCPLREPGYYLGEFYGLNGNIGEGLFLDHTYNYTSTYTEIPIDSAVAFWQVGGYYPQFSRGTDSGELYLISWWLNSNYKIFHSIDTGYTWTEKFESDYINIYYWRVAYTAGREPGSFYVLRSRINPSLNHVWLYIDYSSDYGETFTTYFHDLDSLFTTVRENYAYVIELNIFPNPFKTTTQFCFNLTEESSVAITIYDHTGKKVDIVNPGLLSPGNHSVEFNSAYLSGGIYFCTLEVNGIKTDTKKMTLIK